jgi:hypothetical protein
MRFFLAVLLACAGCARAADDGRVVAILSLIGDGLTIVVRGATVGTSIERNAQSVIKVGTPALDRAALFAAEDAVKRSWPGARTAMLEVKDPAVYAAQSHAIEEDGAVGRVLPALGPVLAGSGATHLVLFTKQSGEAMLQVRNARIGTGRLEGLGFYVDRATRLMDRNGDEYVGFLAPFAYFRVSLVDVSTGKVLGEQKVYASQVTGTSYLSHPWDNMTAQEKMNSLQQMVRQHAARAVPALLQAP